MGCCSSTSSKAEPELTSLATSPDAGNGLPPAPQPQQKDEKTPEAEATEEDTKTFREAPLAPTDGLKIYAGGFEEHAYRMLFEFSELFPDVTPAPTLVCILPSGIIENTKELKPAPDKGFLAYGFAQSMAEEKLAGVGGVSPFIWQRDDGTYALVQAWATNYNDKFRSSFEVTEKNPDETKFAPQAVAEFEQACVNLFGEAARGRTKFCHRGSSNDMPVYVGTRAQILAFLHANPNEVEAMNITSIFEEGFVAGTVDGKGNTGEKSFTMAAEGDYALYVKKGWDTLASTAPLWQFMDNRVLREKKS